MNLTRSYTCEQENTEMVNWPTQLEQQQQQAQQ